MLRSEAGQRYAPGRLIESCYFWNVLCVSNRHAEVNSRLDAHSKGLQALRTEVTLLRSEVQTGRAASARNATTVNERLDRLQDDLGVLAKEVARGGSSFHLVQLEQVQLRGGLEEEVRERRAGLEAADGRINELRDKAEAGETDTRTAMQGLSASIGSLRADFERTLSTNVASIEASKTKVLQCAQAIEKQWSTTKVHHQRLESIHASGALHNQQLQERIETTNKQHMRWRASVEDAVKAVAADVQLVQAHGRAMETAIGSNKADVRRMLSDHESETQRQCDTLGRAIHSLADTLKLTSPLVAINGD